MVLITASSIMAGVRPMAWASPVIQRRQQQYHVPKLCRHPPAHMRTVPVASKSSSAALRRSRSGDDEDELEDGDGLPPESKVYTEKRDWSLDQLAALVSMAKQTTLFGNALLRGELIGTSPRAKKQDGCLATVSRGRT
jgi:hypothetical protein